MLALGGRLAAVVSLFDAVKPEARGVVTALGRSGLECHLLTGTHCLLQAAHDSPCSGTQDALLASSRAFLC